MLHACLHNGLGSAEVWRFIWRCANVYHVIILNSSLCSVVSGCGPPMFLEVNIPHYFRVQLLMETCFIKMQQAFA